MTAAPRQTVFIVDDDEDVRDALAMLMRAAGLQAETFAAAKDFLQRFSPRDSGCLVLDIRMPGMNGTELFLWLRETRPALARRLVFVTGHAGERHLDDEIAAWGIPVLLKPFAVERFIELCSPYLEHRASAALAVTP